MKKFLCVILAVVFVLGVCFSAPFTLNVSAASVSDLTFELNSDGKSYYVSDCSIYAYGEIIIPATYNGLFVTSIGSYAFKFCTSLTSITIPDSVTSIGSSAFSGCTSLTSVKIPDSVTSIGYSAFINCTSLMSIIIPDNIILIGVNAFFNTGYYNTVSNWVNNVLYIGNYLIEAKDSLSGFYSIKYGTRVIASDAFSDCTSLTSITIPDSVTSIGSSAFYNTAYYNDANNWENDVLYIGNHLIKAKTTLSGDYVIKTSTKCIADYAFKDCTSLTSITIPDSVTSIGSYAFINCTSLTSINITNLAAWCNIDFGNSAANPLYYAENLYLSNSLQKNLLIPEGVTEIKPYAFFYCKSIINIKLPKSLKKIGSDAFYGCSNIKMVAISDLVSWCNIEFGGYYANPLYYAKNLYLNGELVTEITIPYSVTSVGDYAFYNCTALTSITIPDCVTSIGNYAFYNCTSLTSIAIPDSVTSIGNYAFYNCTSLTSITLPDSVTSIGDYAFSNCSSLTSITIGDSVTSIGSSAFRWCSSLTSITLPDSVTSIGSSAFEGCTSLTSITLPDSVTSIGEDAFSYCRSLTSITIPDSVTSIGSSAFDGCTSLTSVTIGDSVTSIGNYAFDYCTALTSITIPDSVTSIGSFAFYNCTSLTSVKIGDSVTSIGSSAFEDCTSLTSVKIGDSVTSIGSSAFSDCDSLTSIILPDSVTSIGEDAFYDCTSLTSITIPDSVTSIGSGAFWYCTSLTSITIPDSITSIGSYAFYNCNLKSITIGKGVTSIGKYAFYYCDSLKYVFYTGLQDDWNKISIGSNNSKLTSSPIHYNTTEHGHSVAKNLPFFEGMEGSVEDVCPVCGYVNRSEKLVYVNEYLAGVEGKFVDVNEQSGIITVDKELTKDFEEMVISADGYIITGVPDSQTGLYGTNSVINVFDSDWNFIKSYVFAVQGDVTGDGVCDVLDCMRVQLNVTGWISMGGAYLEASDFNGDGVLTEEDYQSVVNKAIA